MITLADALASPPLAAGDPFLRTGIPGTEERGVRWVHSSEVLEIAALLRGGELLLTGGEVLLGLPPARQADFMVRLGARGVSALCIETPDSARRLSPEALAAAESAGVPVIELRRVVRFVDIAEEINRLIVDGQARVHLAVDRLSQRIARQIMESGADMPAILHFIGSELDAHVRLIASDGSVLGDTGEPLRHAGAGGVADADDGVARHGRPADDGVDGTDCTATGTVVEADIVLDGQLVAQLVLASRTTHHDHLSVAAERLRGILGLAMSQQHRPTLTQISQTNLVAAVVEGRDQRQVRRLWTQNGFAPDTAAAVIIVSGFERGSDGMNLLRALRAQNPQVMTQQREGTMVLLAPLAGDPLQRRAAVLRTAAQAVAKTPLFGVAGPLVWDPADAHTSFSEAEALLRHQPPTRGELSDAMDAFELRALKSLDEGTVLATYSEALLGNVLRWDRAHGSTLVATLQAWFATGCHATLAAQNLHIERQTLHKRLNKIFELLDGDPRRTGRLFALHLAVKYVAE